MPTIVAPPPVSDKNVSEVAISRLSSIVGDLLKNSTGRESEKLLSALGDEICLSAPVSFPDGVGRGNLVAKIFPYHGTIRVDITLEHDRVFGRPDGTPTKMLCYMNDYKTSIALPLDAIEIKLPQEFVLKTLKGVKAAIHAVETMRKRVGSTACPMKIVASDGRK